MMMNKLFRVKLKNSLTNKEYVVYNVRDDKKQAIHIS